MEVLVKSVERGGQQSHAHPLKHVAAPDPFGPVGWEALFRPFHARYFLVRVHA